MKIREIKGRKNLNKTLLIITIILIIVALFLTFKSLETGKSETEQGLKTLQPNLLQNMFNLFGATSSTGYGYGESIECDNNDDCPDLGVADVLPKCSGTTVYKHFPYYACVKKGEKGRCEIKIKHVIAEDCSKRDDDKKFCVNGKCVKEKKAGECDNKEGDINPDAKEICGNKLDEDCDGKIEYCLWNKICVFLELFKLYKCKCKSCKDCEKCQYGICFDKELNEECKISKGENMGRIGYCVEGNCSLCPDCGSYDLGLLGPYDYAETTDDAPISEEEFEDYTKIDLEFTEGIKDKERVMFNLYRVWEDLPKNMKEDFKEGVKIRFLSDEYFKKVDSVEYDCSFLGICKRKKFLLSKKIEIDIMLTEDRDMKELVCTLRHELNHAFYKDPYIKEIENPRDVEWYDITGFSQYGWTEVIGYDHNRIPYYPDCPYYRGPKDGFMRPYAHTNFKEDRATFAQAVYCFPYLFKKLINPKYTACYDEDYIMKLDQLLKDGAISQQEYDKVFQLAFEEEIKGLT